MIFRWLTIGGSRQTAPERPYVISLGEEPKNHSSGVRTKPGGSGNVLPGAGEIDETQIDAFDLFLADESENFLRCHRANSGGDAWERANKSKKRR